MAREPRDTSQDASATASPGARRPFDPPRTVSPVWLVASRLVLLWERLWRSYWILASVLCAALALALTGWTTALSPWPHLALLLVLGLAILAALIHGTRTFHWPSRAEAWHHLESGEDRRHRPLTAAVDQPALGANDPFGALLWRAHRLRMTKAARALRPRWPRPVVPALDPWGLRVLPLLLLVVGLAAGYREPLARITTFLSPNVLPERVAPVARLWLTPPEYTGLPPVRLDTALIPPEPELPPAEGPPDPTLRLPVGTKVLVMVHGEGLDAETKGTLTLGTSTAPLPPLEPGTLRAEGVLGDSGALVVDLDGEHLVDRPLEVIPDTPPRIAFTEEPKGDDRGRTHLNLRAEDDFGLAEAWVEIRPVEALPEDLETALRIDLPSRAAIKGSQTLRAMPDLAAHRWAGRRVGLWPHAKDARGTETTGDVEIFTLPERRFTHPIAQALITQRKLITQSLENYWRVLRALDGLSIRPEAFGGDLSVYLAMRSARAHLARHRLETDVERIRDLLWSAALRVEEGDLSEATRDLDRLSERLKDALSGDPSQEDISRLLRETREAMSAMMRALMESMPRMSPEMMPMMEAMPSSPLDMGAMDQLLRDMEEMNRLGAEEALKEMLAQLEAMVDQMRSLRSMEPSPEMAQAMEEMKAMAEALNALRQEQAELMDETFAQDQARESQSGLPRTPGDQGMNGMGMSRPRPLDEPTPESDALAQRQDALTQKLEQLLGQLGEKTNQIPKDLGEAALAMDQARESLERGDLPGAMGAQGRALDLLSKGRRSAMRSMMSAMGGSMPMMIPLPGSQPGGARPGQDPFGRGIGGTSTEDVGLPSDSEARRAREILQELRRRSNDPDRARPERNYLDRLIPKF